MSLWSALGGSDGEKFSVCTLEQARDLSVSRQNRILDYSRRWLSHFENRLAYEKAMLDEQGGSNADKWDIKPGGMVQIKGHWATVVRVNRSGGVINSVSIAPHPRLGGWPHDIETVKDYTPPTEEQKTAVKKANQLPPLCNYRVPGCIEITSEQWKKIYHDHKAMEVVKGDGGGEYRLRKVQNFIARKFGSTNSEQRGWTPVFLMDQKEKMPPEHKGSIEKIILPFEVGSSSPLKVASADKSEKDVSFEAMKASLKEGVKTISAHQLFPTPPEIAEKMVKIAAMAPYMRVLEPSAGTGNLLKAIGDQADKVAVEINQKLCEYLMRSGVSGLHIIHDDFLNCNGQLGTFDRIIMNPPFENGVDIKHIKHAMNFLNPDGMIVAICADGPRQQDELKPLSDTWEKLPAGSFKDQGTMVNSVILTIRQK